MASKYKKNHYKKRSPGILIIVAMKYSLKKSDAFVTCKNGDVNYTRATNNRGVALTGVGDLDGCRTDPK